MGPNGRFWCRQDDFKTCSRILECLALLVLDVQQLFAGVYDARLMVRTDTVLLWILVLEWPHLWRRFLLLLPLNWRLGAVRSPCFILRGLRLLLRPVSPPAPLEDVKVGVEELWHQVAQVPSRLLFDRDDRVHVV